MLSQLLISFTVVIVLLVVYHRLERKTQEKNKIEYFREKLKERYWR